MKKQLTILLSFISILLSAQDISLYTAGAKFLITKTKINPIVIDLIEKTLPKALNKDIDGAVSEFSGVICEKKKIKELNPAFAKYVSNKIRYLAKAIPKGDYFDITMSLSDFILVTDDFLSNNKAPDNTNLNTNKLAKSIVDSLSINKTIVAVPIDRKAILDDLKKINTDNKKLQCIAFTSFGGYTILYGTNGYFSSGIPKNASEKLKELHDNKKEIKHIAYSPTGGYVILYGKSGWASSSVSPQLNDKLTELNKKESSIESVSFSPDGGYVVIYDKSGYASNKIPVSLTDKLKEINSKNLEIKNVSFEDDGGYVINYGKSGFTSVGISKTASDKLHELNKNSKTIDFVSFVTGGGHIIVYDNYGYAYSGAK